MGLLGGRRTRPLPPATATPAPPANAAARWRPFSPVVYRYIQKRYVKAFFADGTLRLTSFSRCRRHADEQRLDAEEGLCRVVVTSRQTDLMHAIYEIEAGAGAFVLCTSLWHNRELMGAFGCDSFIRIHDPAEFGVRVSRHVPGFTQGGEGPCMYQQHRLIEAAVDDAVLPAEGPRSQVPDDGRRSEAIAGAIKHYPYFLKHKSFSHQAEYRLLWMTSSPDVPDYLDIRVPEARELCSLPGAFEFDDGLAGSASATR